MLDHLDPWEFEDWCKILLERQHGCRVELTRRTGDEGRDLIVHHHDGPIVVECKHYPSGQVGRPALQKLHSAVVTYGATRGALLTSGRFSEEAKEYLRKVREDITLIDGVQLDVAAQRVGMTPGGHAGFALGIPTTSSETFPDVLTASIFTPERYADGQQGLPILRIARKTVYNPFFVARYDAHGKVNTAVGTRSASWDGQIWLDACDGSMDVGGVPGMRPESPPTRTLSEVLDATPGAVPDPVFHANEAVERMRSHLLERLSASVRYRGRNNVVYTKTISPTRSSMQVNQMQLLYAPRQIVRIEGLRRPHEGILWEERSRLELQVPSLAACTVCRGTTNAHDQVFCSACGVTAHRPSRVRGESFRCAGCGATLCRRDSFQTRAFGKIHCKGCTTPESRPLPPRGLAVLLLALALTMLLLAHIWLADPTDLRPHALAFGGAWFLVALRMWPRGITSSGKPLIYDTRQPVANVRQKLSKSNLEGPLTSI